MIDLHTHVLPGMDDGSRSPEESAQILKKLAAQGVTLAAATPHFYASENSPNCFLRRRQAAWERLEPMLEPGMPQLVLGAEVYYFEGLCRNDELPQLCMDGTNALLLEMPFEPWSHRVLGDLLELSNRGDIQVILAHVERYFPFQGRDTWNHVLQSPVLMQSNADFFLTLRTRHKALRLVRDGQVQLLGSDCHGIERRPPRIGPAATYIRSHLGNEVLEHIDTLAASLLHPEPAAQR